MPCCPQRSGGGNCDHGGDYSWRYTLTTTVTPPAFRWAAVWAILTFSFTVVEQSWSQTASMSHKKTTPDTTLTTTMTHAFRWAVVLAVLTFSFTEEEQRQNRTASKSHERLYLMLRCHPHIDFCMQIGSIVGCFKVFIHCGGTKLK